MAELSSGPEPQGRGPRLCVTTTVTTTVVVVNLDTGEVNTSSTHSTTRGQCGSGEDDTQERTQREATPIADDASVSTLTPLSQITPPPRRGSSGLSSMRDSALEELGHSINASTANRVNDRRELIIIDLSDTDSDDEDMDIEEEADDGIDKNNAPVMRARLPQLEPAPRKKSKPGNPPINWDRVTSNLFAKSHNGDGSQASLVHFRDWPAPLQAAVQGGLDQSTGSANAVNRLCGYMESPGTKKGVCLMEVCIRPVKFNAPEAQARGEACQSCANPNWISRPCLTACPGGGLLLMPLREGHADLDVVGHWLINH
ncbi:hypothetical protein IWZ01DRAFT_540602 [Phyllosticta capitalensis]